MFHSTLLHTRAIPCVCTVHPSEHLHSLIHTPSPPTSGGRSPSGDAPYNRTLLNLIAVSLGSGHTICSLILGPRTFAASSSTSGKSGITPRVPIAFVGGTGGQLCSRLAWIRERWWTVERIADKLMPDLADVSKRLKSSIRQAAAKVDRPSVDAVAGVGGMASLPV